MSAMQKGMFSLMDWTSEMGSRSLVHGVMAGKEGHGKNISVGKIKSEPSYTQTERAMAHSERPWGELIETHEQEASMVMSSVLSLVFSSDSSSDLSAITTNLRSNLLHNSNRRSVSCFVQLGSNKNKSVFFR